MGNICGKESADPFSKPGRTVSSLPPQQNTTSAIPSSAGRKIGGPARPLGGGGSSGGGQTDVQKEDARRKAAEAAQARANAASKPKGKLGAALQGQKKQTRTSTLEAASAEERGHRQLDSSQQQQRYD